jgi:hypothetical protein
MLRSPQLQGGYPHYNKGNIHLPAEWFLGIRGTMYAGRKWAVMAYTSKTSNEQRKVLVVENMWLHHYNNTLFEKGLITESQHRRMKTSINSRVRPVTEGAWFLYALYHGIPLERADLFRWGDGIFSLWLYLLYICC